MTSRRIVHGDLVTNNTFGGGDNILHDTSGFALLGTDGNLVAQFSDAEQVCNKRMKIGDVATTDAGLVVRGATSEPNDMLALKRVNESGGIAGGTRLEIRNSQNDANDQAIPRFDLNLATPPNNTGDKALLDFPGGKIACRTIQASVVDFTGDQSVGGNLSTSGNATVSQNLTCGTITCGGLTAEALGTAAKKNVGQVADGNTGLVTGDDVHDACALRSKEVTTKAAFDALSNSQRVTHHMTIRGLSQVYAMIDSTVLTGAVDMSGASSVNLPDNSLTKAKITGLANRIDTTADGGTVDISAGGTANSTALITSGAVAAGISGLSNFYHPLMTIDTTPTTNANLIYSSAVKVVNDNKLSKAGGTMTGALNTQDVTLGSGYTLTAPAIDVAALDVSSTITVPDGSLAIGKIDTLQATLNAKMTKAAPFRNTVTFSSTASPRGYCFARHTSQTQQNMNTVTPTRIAWAADMLDTTYLNYGPGNNSFQINTGAAGVYEVSANIQLTSLALRVNPYIGVYFFDASSTTWSWTGFAGFSYIRDENDHNFSTHVITPCLLTCAAGDRIAIAGRYSATGNTGATFVVNATSLNSDDAKLYSYLRIVKVT